MKILAAEDDAVARAVLRQALRRLGHEVIEAADGEAAWELLADSPVRVVVSDWMMPRLDGLGLCRRIRAQPKAEYVYFILLTSSDATEDNQRTAADAGVDDFLTNVGGDDRINHFFANTDLKRLNTMLVNQIGQATGGPQKYTGRDMKTAHAGLKIMEDDFNALVEDLVKSLDKFKVPEKEKSELLAILGPMKPDIVTA